MGNMTLSVALTVENTKGYQQSPSGNNTPVNFMTKENKEMESKLTKFTTSQLNITWDTKQTLSAYLQILKDNETEYDEELFLEYVASNFLDWIRESSDKDILREIVILNDDGEDLNNV
jgi:hypothetical protein